MDCRSERRVGPEQGQPLFRRGMGRQLGLLASSSSASPMGASVAPIPYHAKVSGHFQSPFSSSFAPLRRCSLPPPLLLHAALGERHLCISKEPSRRVHYLVKTGPNHSRNRESARRNTPSSRLDMPFPMVLCRPRLTSGWEALESL